MLCSTIKDLSKIKEKDYIMEIKWDGTRVWLYVEDYKPEQLLNRRGIDVLNRYPELKSLKVSSKRGVLDCELVILKEGKCDFSALLSREHLKDDFKIKLMSKRFPATLMAFDVLGVGDKVTGNMPLVKRKELLSKITPTNSNKSNDYVGVEIVPYYEKLETALKEMQKNEHEGIVLKKKDSLYVNERSNNWLKFKKRIEKVIRFDNYEDNKDGSITLTNGHDRVKCNTPEKAIDELYANKFVDVEVEGLEITEENHIRFPILKRIIEGEENHGQD